MLKEERLSFITRQLETNESVKLETLSKALQVSEDTIRRDIETLARNGKVIKVRGGAIPHSPNPYNFKDRINKSVNEKLNIAKKALGLIQPGNTILLDGGTTNYALAGLLNIPLTVITNNIPIAALLGDRKDIEVIVTGGRIFPASLVTTGNHAIKMLEQLHVDVYFLGVCSLHHEIGASSIDYPESELKRAMVNCADKIVALSEHDKLGTAETYKICPIEKIDVIVSDVDPESDVFDVFRKKNIHVI